MRDNVDFRNISDTGEIDSNAIVPYNDGESANQTVLRRPVENTRSRTEVLRTLAREHVLMRDIDRSSPGIWGGGTITFNGTVAGGGGGDGEFTITSSLFVVPMITPGDGGTSSPYIASSKAVLTVGTLGNNQVIIEAVQAQFEGSDIAKADGNRLSVEILNDTAESIALEGATGDVNNVKITIISGTTTAQDLIDLINNDATVVQYVTASLEATSTGTNAAALWGPTEWGSDFSQRFLKGGHPGVVHEIPSGNLSSFFSAHAENPLKKGDTLAISYDDIIDYSGTGGVLQSTPENSNTVIGAGSLFNTRREPEKCINAVPICKCIDDNTLLFIDGSYFIKDVSATLIFDSGSVANAASSGTIDVTGWTRMHQAPGAHTPPTTVQQALNNADDIFESTIAEVAAARNSTVYGAQASLDARIELADTEINAARTSSVYGAQASLDARIELADAEINAARSSSVFGAQSTLDARIEAVDTHAATIVTVGPTGSGRMYEGATALYDALNALKDAGGIIIVDNPASAYSMSGNLTITRPIHIIGKDRNLTRLDLGTYKLTFDGSGSAAGSSISNIYFESSSTGVQLEFGDPWCRVENCFITTEMQLTSSAMRFSMRMCNFFVTWATSIIVNANYVSFTECSWIHTGDGDYEVVDVNDLAEHTSFDTCDFALGGGNHISTGLSCTLRNIQISAGMDYDTTTAVLSAGNGSVVDGLSITHTGTNHIVQPALSISGMAKNVYIDCDGYEVRLYGKQLVLVSSSATQKGVLDTFQIENFNIPFDTNALGDFPLVNLYGAADMPVHLCNGKLHGISHNSASGAMTGYLVGSSAFTGAAVIDNITIDTTGISYASNTLRVFGLLDSHSIIKNCRVMGTGVLDTAIYITNADYVALLNNKLSLAGAWDRAIYVYNASYCKVQQNEIVFNGAMTDNVIEVTTSGSDGHNNVSHNSIENTGSAWTTAEGIELNDQDSDMVFGNVVPADVGTNHINYAGTCTNMVPASANLATYNVLT